MSNNANGNHYYTDSFHTFKEPTAPHEKQSLLKQNNTEVPLTEYRSGNIIIGGRNDEDKNMQAVTLQPSWEEKDISRDELNFKTYRFDNNIPYSSPPRDRCNLIYLILVLHGIGVLTPWNTFITAKAYFEEYKLLEDDDSGLVKEYRNKFINYISFAFQIPNIIFNFINIFIQIGGDLTTRIIISILAEIIIFIGTIVLAMVDTSTWTVVFFWITMASIILLNMANGIYQNSIYGLAANLPMKYTNAVVLGSNVSGTLAAVINIMSLAMSPNQRTAAIYYFITALLILLTCFDTYFALPLSRFYRYYERQAEAKKASLVSVSKGHIPYWSIFKKTSLQLWNIFFIFFVTLTIFPAIHANIKRYDPNFIISEKYYMPVTCFFIFNFFAMLGNFLSMLCRRPGPTWLTLVVFLRILFIPAFMICNYKTPDMVRALPILIYNDWAYIGLGMLLGLTSGYFSSLAMMYASRCVEPQHAPIAGMMAATSLVVGIFCGVNFALVVPVLVENIYIPEPNWS